MGRERRQLGESRITLKLKDGRILKRDAPTSRGWPEDPVLWDDVKARYAECADGILSPAQIVETIDMIAGWSASIKCRH